MNKQLLTEQYVWYQKRAARVAAVVVVALGGLLLNSPMALAALELCNSTDVTLYTAVASPRDAGWTSAGWHKVKPGRCRTVVRGALKNRHYYVYAKGHDVQFAGPHTFCTIPDGFKIIGTNCSRKGYTSTGFQQIHTGNAYSYTVSFTTHHPHAHHPHALFPGHSAPVGGVTITPSAINGAISMPSTADGQSVVWSYPSNLGHAVIHSSLN